MKTGKMMVQNVVVKTIYYTECDKSPIENFAQYVRENYISGTYLIKVWNSGNTIGFYKVA
jgi:hypothetical protein